MRRWLAVMGAIVVLAVSALPTVMGVSCELLQSSERFVIRRNA